MVNVNLLKSRNIIKKDSCVKIKKNEKSWNICNPTNKEVTLIIPKVHYFKKNNMQINFQGKVIKGEKGILLKIANRTGRMIYEVGLNKNYFTPRKTKFFMVALRV